MMTLTEEPQTITDVLDRSYSLPADAAVRYARDGHVLLRDVLPAEDVEVSRRCIREAALEFGQKQDLPLEKRDTYGKAFLQHKNLWVHDEGVKRFVLARRLGRIAAELMGVEGVRIYHDQALFKEPGGGATPWHQDQYYWPIDTDKTITMWMPLVDITSDMGMLTFASRSQNQGYLGTLPISDKSNDVFQRYVAEKGFEISRPDAMKAGDATFHAGWTLHCAPGNESDVMREVMTIIYVADGAKVSTPINKNQERDLGGWLPGLKPGDLVGSDINPLIG